MSETCSLCAAGEICPHDWTQAPDGAQPAPARGQPGACTRCICDDLDNDDGCSCCHVAPCLESRASPGRAESIRQHVNAIRAGNTLTRHVSLRDVDWLLDTIAAQEQELADANVSQENAWASVNRLNSSHAQTYQDLQRANMELARLLGAVQSFVYGGLEPHPSNEEHREQCAVYDAYQHGPCDCGLQGLVVALAGAPTGEEE